MKRLAVETRTAPRSELADDKAAADDHAEKLLASFQKHGGMDFCGRRHVRYSASLYFFSTNHPMASATATEVETTSQKPVKTIRLRGISASIFANKAKSEGREMTFHKVSVQRSYKDGGEWKQTTSFGRDDLPVVQLVLQRAWEAILDMKSASAKEEAAE